MIVFLVFEVKKFSEGSIDSNRILLIYSAEVREEIYDDGFCLLIKGCSYGGDIRSHV